MAESVEVSFVDESDFQKESKWCILSKIHSLKYAPQFSSDINGSLAGISDFSEDTVSETGAAIQVVFSSHDGSNSDTAAIIISGTLDISNFFVLQSKSVDL